jgi:hypothetical protein
MRLSSVVVELEELVVSTDGAAPAASFNNWQSGLVGSAQFVATLLLQLSSNNIAPETSSIFAKTFNLMRTTITNSLRVTELNLDRTIDQRLPTAFLLNQLTRRH